MFKKIKEGIDKGVTVVSVKSGTFIEINKINAMIENHQKKINEYEKLLGQKIYEQWEVNEIDELFISQECEKIKQKYEEIDRLKLQKIQIENEKNQVLGEEEKVCNEEMACKCGMQNDKESKFCIKCGKKLV